MSEQTYNLRKLLIVYMKGQTYYGSEQLSRGCVPGQVQSFHYYSRFKKNSYDEVKVI